MICRPELLSAALELSLDQQAQFLGAFLGVGYLLRACWLGDQLWRGLHLDTFFAPRLGCSREGTDWEKVLRVLTLYRLLSPGS